MEYGLRLLEPRVPPGDPRGFCPSAPAGALPEAPVAALYFGTEFCEERIPDPEEAEAFCALAQERRWRATLLTPLVTDAGLRRIDRLLRRLAGRGREPAVVFNDWGVLRMVREHHPRLALRAGRLVNRGLRDPRALEEGAREEWLRPADPARGARLRRFLATLGVEALETDPDLDGGYLGDGGAGLGRALHVPYVLASSGRHCLPKAAALPGRAIGELLGEPCPRPCRQEAAARADRADCSVPLWRAGNTLLYEIPWPAAEARLPEADRVVLHEAPSP